MNKPDNDSPAAAMAKTNAATKGVDGRYFHVNWKSILRQERLSYALTITDVARAVGMSVSQLSRVERGEDTCLSTAIKLARFYRRPVEELWPGLVEEAAE